MNFNFFNRNKKEEVRSTKKVEKPSNEVENEMEKTQNMFHKNAEILNKYFPYNKFPSDINIENEGRKFLITKDGAPNEVSVIVDSGMMGELPPHWEIMTGDLNGDSLVNVELEDTEGLIKAIEETLYFKPLERDLNDQDDDNRIDDLDYEYGLTPTKEDFEEERNILKKKIEDLEEQLRISKLDR